VIMLWMVFMFRKYIATAILITLITLIVLAKFLKSILYSELGMVKRLRLSGRCITSHFFTLPELQRELSHEGSPLKI
jgi:hypothetical protein